MPAKPKFDSRKLMERAVEIMRESIPERRRDGKKSPVVGAVLWKPGGTVETAYRGELRDGDHAEFTVLERKNRSNRLDGCALFVTLEPCGPESRNHPKLSCAERIVLGRIKEVWVGLEDPDPTVDRKGIKYLQDNDVTVQMFDRDLQETIRDENKDFIAQALERAAEAEKKPKTVTLSPFEHSVAAADMRDFSTEALERYHTVAKLPEAIESEAFRRRLLQQGLLKEERGELVPSGFGLLLFGQTPRDVMPQAGLLATIHYPNGKDETRDFDGPLVLIPDQVEKWLNDKLPNTIDRSRMQRQKIPELPFELIREPIVNGLVHRDYEIVGAKCQLVITADTVAVKSPGRPIPPITVEQLQNFNAPMLSRNPVLHYVFARMDLAEERGLGLQSFKSLASKLGLPVPKFAFEDPYLVLTVYRSPASAVHDLAPSVLKRLNADEKSAWQFIASKDSVSSPELIAELRFDERKAQRVLSKLVGTKLLQRVGKGRATRYKLLRA
ncbi:MAG TPA: ATP-binding protein [Chthoniobacterales bacterium]